jgi:hypothetical protein
MWHLSSNHPDLFFLDARKAGESSPIDWTIARLSGKRTPVGGTRKGPGMTINGMFVLTASCTSIRPRQMSRAATAIETCHPTSRSPNAAIVERRRKAAQIPDA